MKKPMSIMCALILTLLAGMIVTGCGEAFIREVNKSHDDDISKAIYEAVGRKKVHYWGKTSYNSDETDTYEYLIHDYKDENVLKDMVEAANVVMKEKATTEKKDLLLLDKVSGRYEPVVSIRTYYECQDECFQYESFQTLFIYGTDQSTKSDNNPYDKLSTYIDLPDIKSLAVSKKIAQIAEEEGIDWYEIWPDLEHYKVFED
ncbi:MAG: hypothetical protein K2O59_07090 [Lachnospiraceae bacterium]|nr:hypothetical protein [Lachnospiraceae bacterium]